MSITSASIHWTAETEGAWRSKLDLAAADILWSLQLKDSGWVNVKACMSGLGLRHGLMVVRKTLNVKYSLTEFRRCESSFSMSSFVLKSDYLVRKLCLDCASCFSSTPPPQLNLATWGLIYWTTIELKRQSWTSFSSSCSFETWTFMSEKSSHSKSRSSSWTLGMTGRCLQKKREGFKMPVTTFTLLRWINKICNGSNKTEHSCQHYKTFWTLLLESHSSTNCQQSTQRGHVFIHHKLQPWRDDQRFNTTS